MNSKATVLNPGSEADKTRLAFAGLKFAEYGSFDYGRNYGVAYDIGAWTDVLPEFGGDTWTQTDVFMTGRTTGVATYRNTDFFGLVEGLNFAAQYQGKNDRATTKKLMATVLVCLLLTSMKASALVQPMRNLTVLILRTTTSVSSKLTVKTLKFGLLA
jgi:predicted porin